MNPLCSVRASAELVMISLKVCTTFDKVVGGRERENVPVKGGVVGVEERAAGAMTRRELSTV